ncbi:MAG: serine/threonine-protein kinase [Thermoguttaceae bacterium]
MDRLVAGVVEARNSRPIREVTAAAPVLEGWELVRKVTEGTYADVYRARPAERCDRTAGAYAIKVLRDPWSQRREIVELVRTEARVGRAVSHPHLVSVLAARTAARPYFSVYPWLDGETLAAGLARRRLDLPIALWIARQAAEALAAMERAGWLHGDVKPANVIVSPGGHATLIDLGFAQRLGEDGGAVDRPLMGTWHYLAPERITSRLGADIRSDLYSLGAVLFESLSGRVPFDAETPAELVEQHRSRRAPDLRRLDPSLPPELTRLVREMMAKNPWHRPSSAREVVERLAELEIATFGER